MVDSFGSCRVCLVEIEGRAGTPSSCTTPVARHGGEDPDRTAEQHSPRRHGTLRLRPSARLGPVRPNGSEFDEAGVGRPDATSATATMARNHVFKKQGRRTICAGCAKDESNPYFTYDPSQCIVCSRCVRACEEVQGTFALTIEGRGFESPRRGRHAPAFHGIRMRVLRRLRAGLPDRALTEKSVIKIGQPEHSVVTTCAYCGVGCSFKAEMRGDELIRMVPWKDGKANRGHSCVKGRFAWGYATHKERILNPMIREKISDPWREVSWDEAFAHIASEFRRIQYQYGRTSIGGITSSRCTNEETYLVQKLMRQGFGNNNVDTCARVCHSPTGYGLGQTFGTSAGTQDFDSVEDTDVAVIIGANPTDGHPVFASRLKKRLREGRQADRSRSAPHRYRALGACRGRLPSAAEARHECRGHHLAGACHRHRRPVRRKLHPRALRLVGVRGLGGLRRRAAATAPRRSRSCPAFRRSISAGRRAFTPRAAMARSITASASPSTARARPR